MSFFALSNHSNRFRFLIAGAALTAAPALAETTDPQFQALFQQWKSADQLGARAISIPSQKPVEGVSFTSGFGVRADPFRGSAAMHAGVDLAGQTGTPVYATADGMVSWANWRGGYGNLVEVNHGKGVATRYGHLSRIVTQPGKRVRRGELIGLMGSTGRSTGSHLHYEVRIDGRAVNPIPYLQTADYVANITRGGATGTAQVAQGGPEIPEQD